MKGAKDLTREKECRIYEIQGSGFTVGVAMGAAGKKPRDFIRNNYTKQIIIL